MTTGRMIAWLTAAALIPVLPAGTEAAEVSPEKGTKKVIGYLPEWNYQPYKELDFSALTHINIAFFEPDAAGVLQCDIPDSELKKDSGQGTSERCGGLCCAGRRRQLGRLL